MADGINSLDMARSFFEGWIASMTPDKPERDRRIHEAKRRFEEAVKRDGLRPSLYRLWRDWQDLLTVDHRIPS